MTIRKAAPDDAEPIATLLLLAMEEIVYQFTGEKNPGKAKAFLFHFTQQENNQYSYQNCWVVEENDRVIAAANLYDGARLHELRQPVLDYIHNQLQIPFNPEDETGTGELYIDSLGVDPPERGKGIGSKLIAFLVDEYVNRQGQTLGLLVEETNPDAKRLYLKSGFTIKGQKRIFRKNMEHLQISPAESRGSR